MHGFFAVGGRKGTGELVIPFDFVDEEVGFRGKLRVDPLFDFGKVGRQFFETLDGELFDRELHHLLDLF